MEKLMELLFAITKVSLKNEEERGESYDDILQRLTAGEMSKNRKLSLMKNKQNEQQDEEGDKNVQNQMTIAIKNQFNEE